jgi:hypothetical protein
MDVLREKESIVQKRDKDISFYVNAMYQDGAGWGGEAGW